MKNLTLILVPIGTRRQLCQLFNVSYTTVRRALSGIVTNPKHAEIRKKALELGGILANSNTVQ